MGPRIHGLRYRSTFHSRATSEDTFYCVIENSPWSVRDKIVDSCFRPTRRNSHDEALLGGSGGHQISAGRVTMTQRYLKDRGTK